MKKKWTCPECKKELKSKSGYTLHIKKCCPEMRFLETRVKMVIEFVAPRNVERLPALGMFRDSFGPYDRKDGGCSQIKSARVISATVTPRKASQKEQDRMARALKNRDKGAAIRELKKLLTAMVGEGWAYQTNARDWPREIVITTYPKSQRHTYQTINFLFKLEKERLRMVHVRSQFHIERPLADPKLAEYVKAFTSGLKPSVLKQAIKEIDDAPALDFAHGLGTDV